MAQKLKYDCFYKRLKLVLKLPMVLASNILPLSGPNSGNGSKAMPLTSRCLSPLYGFEFHLREVRKLLVTWF